MAKLYLANLGKQTHEFHYRIPAEQGFSRREQVQTITPGTQQMIHGEAPMPVLEAIVEQHRIYGLIEVSELVNHHGFAGLVASFDKPVQLDVLNYGIDRNQGELHDIGVKRREEAAVAFDAAVEQNLIEAQHRGDLRGSATLRAVSVETLEDGDNPRFGEGIRVDHITPPDRRRA
jgi:hypothetical protein